MLRYDPGSISLVALLLVIRCHVMVGVGMEKAEHDNTAVPPTVTTVLCGTSVNLGLPICRHIQYKWSASQHLT